MLATPRGKVLGGSSSINGMVYVRGHPRDFDHWAEIGADGWAWADVAPYFIRMEHWHGGHSDWRGSDGPLHVTRGPRRNPLYHSFVEAGAQAGFELTYDYNGAKQEGFGADGADGLARPALVGRQRLPAPGAGARQRHRRLTASPPAWSSPTAAPPASRSPAATPAR